MTDNSNLSTVDNKTAATIDINEISVPIATSYRKPCRLDWAESYWVRWIYVVLFSWLNPILNIGYKRQLTEDDLFELSPNDECGQLLKKIETVWEKNENKYEY